MGLDLAAGRREEGKKADTAHISLVGSRERSAWLEGKGASLLLTPAGEAGALRGRNSPGRARCVWQSSSGAAWRPGHTGTVPMGKTRQAWPDFPRFLPVELGHFKA